MFLLYDCLRVRFTCMEFTILFFLSPRRRPAIWALSEHFFSFFFFFKQTTAYEFVSRDWSSDVCSSDLYNGSPIPLLGMIDLSCTYQDRQYPAKFYISKNPEWSSLVGLGLARAMGLVPSVGVGEVSDSGVLSQYCDVFEGLGKIASCQHNITLDPKVRPVACSSRSVPIYIMPKLKAELERLENEGIISRCNEPTEWVSPIAIDVKPNKQIRLCIDPVYLNPAIMREHYTLPTTQEIFSRLGSSKYFSVVDAKNGFHQIELSETSKRLTTFITPFGRWYFERLPFGLRSSAEVFQKAMMDKFGELEGVEIYIDDILVHADTKEQHDIRLHALLKRCQEVNLKLNRDKSQICKSEVTFLGHTLSDGIAPKRDKTSAILDMKAPTCREEVMRLIGMVNYLSHFCKDLAEINEPLRKLIHKDSKDNDFIWDDACQKAFTDIKTMIASAPVLQRFHKDEEITIQVDASSHALGAVLMQNGRPVEYATKALTDTQKRYSQVEKELLAVLFGCRKFHYYVYGGDLFTVQTDHKSLVSMIQNEIDSLPSPRLRRMVLNLRDYGFNLVYKSGKELVIADTLSRACYDAELDQVDTFDPMSITKEKLFPYANVLEKYQRSTENDHELQRLYKIVLEGWPEHKKSSGFVGRKYWHVKDRISIHDGLLFMDDRVIVPLERQRKVLEKLHAGHLGIVKTVNLAKTSVFWLGMRNHIEDMIASCTQCQVHSSKEQKQPLLSSEVPQYPFHIVSSDVFHYNAINYLLIVDHYSKWYQVKPIKTLSSQEVIAQFDDLFTSFGIPRIIRSDNASYYVSAEFKGYCENNNVQLVTSSPGYPQSNGMAEAFVKIAKSLVMKCEGDMTKINAGLRQYRNTPVNDKIPSPARLLQGRSIQDGLPRLEKTLIPNSYDYEQIQANRAYIQSTQKFYYDRKAGKELEVLNNNQKVRVFINDKWVFGKIKMKCQEPRSYIVTTDRGDFRRTQNHIKVTEEQIGLGFSSGMDYGASSVGRASVAQPGNVPMPTNSAQSPAQPKPTNTPAKPPECMATGQPYQTRAGRAIRQPDRLGYDK